MTLINLYPNKNQVVIVDDEDYEYLNQFKWYLSYYGYAVRNTKMENGNKKSIKMHREILKVQSNEFIDHINHNRLDNRKSNLRIATKSQNAANSKKRKSSSKFKGVSWIQILGKWRARIRVNGKSYHLGVFNNEIDAAIAYNTSAKLFFGEFAYINKVD